MAVERNSGNKNTNRNGETNCGKAITKGPTNVVLNVNKNYVSKKGAKENAEHPPIEKGKLLLLFLRVEVVELIGTDGRYIWLCSTRAEREGVECAKVDGKLLCRGLLAMTRGRFGARRWP